MAFCENCGTQLSDGAKFCGSCGKPAGAGVASQPSAPPKRSSATAVILGTVAFLVLLVCLSVGAGLYFFHRVSTKADDVTQGLPDVNALVKALPGLGSQPPATPPASHAPLAGLDENKLVTSEEGQCALFSKEELTRVLETNFTHADADRTGCTYKGDAPREFVRTEALWKGGGKPVKDKRDAYESLSRSMSKAERASHVFPMQLYPGVGDEAWVNLVNVVTARKGDVGIIMDLRYYHDSDDITRMLVNAALSRLGGGDSAPAATPKPPQ